MSAIHRNEIDFLFKLLTPSPGDHLIKIDEPIERTSFFHKAEYSEAFCFQSPMACIEREKQKDDC
jgi:hypothetical protein